MNTNPFNKISTNVSCVKILVQNFTQNCIFTPYPMKFQDTFTVSLNNIRYIYIKNPTNGILQCGPQKLMKRFFGLQKVHPECSFSTPRQQILPVVHAITKTRVNINQDTNLFRSEIFHINGSLQDTKLVHIKQINETLEAIKTDTNRNITDIKLHHEYVTLFTQVHSWTTVMVIIIICIIISVMMRNMYQRMEIQATRHEENDNVTLSLLRLRRAASSGTI